VGWDLLTQSGNMAKDCDPCTVGVEITPV